jgi:hypothetical protein
MKSSFCSKCLARQSQEDEIYRVEHKREVLYFNVTKAKELAPKHATLETLETERVEMLLAVNTPDPEHTLHVDDCLEEPGLVGLLYDNVERDFVEIVFLDGTHRLARCRQLGLPCRVHVLSEEATRACYLSSASIKFILERMKHDKITTPRKGFSRKPSVNRRKKML